MLLKGIILWLRIQLCLLIPIYIGIVSFTGLLGDNIDIDYINYVGVMGLTCYLAYSIYRVLDEGDSFKVSLVVYSINMLISLCLGIPQQLLSFIFIYIYIVFRKTYLQD